MKKRNIIICVVCITLLLIIASPILIIKLHTRFNQAQLDNAIIDGGFKDWYTVQLDEEHTIKIPNGWKLQIDKNLALYDDTGKQVAFGKIFEDLGNIEETHQFLSNYYDDALISCETGDMQDIPDTIHTWFDENCFFESGEVKRLLRVNCRVSSPGKRDCTYVLYFEEPTDELHEIATAMLYSSRKNSEEYGSGCRGKFLDWLDD